jgi:putative ABC transport system permease protein
MTLTRLVTRNAFRNRRRSILTVLSISFSLLLLTIMMSLWCSFYIDQGTAESAKRLITRHRVSLVFLLPAHYREKIRALPGVVHVVPMTWFGGIYKDQRPENFFAQFGTDPAELLDVVKDIQLPPDQLGSWQRDRTGVIVDSELAKKHGWKVGDRIVLKGTIFPMNLELTVRGIFTSPRPTNSLYFNYAYVEEAVPEAKGQVGFLNTRVDSPEAVARVSRAIDDLFRNSPQPTKTESVKAFQLSFVAMLGNVKAFILSICLAVVFTILLVSANTMAMSIRERTREVALLKTLGFPRQTILALCVAEGVALSLVGGLLGVLGASAMIRALTNSPVGIGVATGLSVAPATLVVALLVAASVGFLSTVVPSYHASRGNIVEGLRHIG